MYCSEHSICLGVLINWNDYIFFVLQIPVGYVTMIGELFQQCATANYLGDVWYVWLCATSSFTLLKCQRYSALLDGLSFAPNGLHQHWWCCHCLYRQLCSSRQCSQLLPKKTQFKKWESRDWSLLLYLFICLLLFLVLNSTLEECEGEQGACVTAHLQVLNSTLEGCEGEQGACVTAHLQVRAEILLALCMFCGKTARLW